MNDQDPLAQLRDIHLPDSVGFWPPAPGWWILAFLILAVIVIALVKTLRYKQQNRYRLKALQSLNLAWEAYQKDKQVQDYLFQLSQLLKRTALSAYPQLMVNSFHGQQWLAFLDRTNNSAEKEFSEGIGKTLATLPYQKISANTEYSQQDLQGLHNLCLAWIKSHRSQTEVMKSRYSVEASNQNRESSPTNNGGQGNVAI